MTEVKTYKIIIEQITKQEHEVTLTGDSAMDVLDQARLMVLQRNKSNNNPGTIYSVTKVEELK
jgi:hypothetical protein